MKIFQIIRIFFLVILYFTHNSCGPIYNIPSPPPPPVNDPNTHPELDSVKMRTWKWSEISIPNYTWPDGTAFGNGLFVDIAHDATGVTINSDKLHFYLNPLVPTAPTNSSSGFNYRSEIRTAPWQINHDLGTEQWIGWSYTFSPDYVIDPSEPFTIYQNHPGIAGQPPMFELEIAALNRPNPAQGGEIQVVNHALNNRFVSNVKPQAGETLNFVVHVVFEEGSKGLLQVWINDNLIYSEIESTVLSDYKWGGNNKWGIYHHTHLGNQTAVNNSIAAGAKEVSLDMGTLRLLQRSTVAPNYRTDAFDLVKPR